MKILIIKPSSFGDIIHANPALAALRKLYPAAEISWLVFDVWSEIISMFPDVDKTVIWKKEGGLNEYTRLIKYIRKQKYDLVIDLQGLARTGNIAFLSGAKKKIGVPGLKEMSGLLVKEVFPESASLNAVKRSLEVVRYLGGKDLQPVFELGVKAIKDKQAHDLLCGAGVKPKDKLIGIVPYVRGKSKQWPYEYYTELINLIIKSPDKVKIVVLGNEKTFKPPEDPNVVDLSTKTTLGSLAGVIRRCSVVVGGDTGSVQLAAALGIPTVVIFGGSDVNETAPLSDKSTILKKDYDCSPCRTHPKCKGFPCLKDIKPEEAFEAVMTESR